MLIEDDETMRSLLHTLLQIEGYQVANFTFRETVNDILVDIHQEQPDLLLLDVRLRQLSGLDLLPLIRSDPGLQNCQVLMCSGMDVSHDCLERGADGFILKPYMPEELIGKINQLLKGSYS